MDRRRHRPLQAQLSGVWRGLGLSMRKQNVAGVSSPRQREHGRQGGRPGRSWRCRMVLSPRTVRPTVLCSLRFRLHRVLRTSAVRHGSPRQRHEASARQKRIGLIPCAAEKKRAIVDGSAADAEKLFSSKHFKFGSAKKFRGFDNFQKSVKEALLRKKVCKKQKA